MLETNNGTTKYTRGKPGPHSIVSDLTVKQKEFLSEDTNHFFDYLDAVRAWKFQTGTKEIDVLGQGICQYNGEIDVNSKLAYGEGTLTWSDGSIAKSTWLNNKRHGFCSFTNENGERLEGEVRNGEWKGELTVYW